MSRLRVLVADDELLARKRLERLLGAMPDVELVGLCGSGEEVLAKVAAGGVDVLLLDIHMPGLSGLDAMALLPSGGPTVVFCTAHPDHAVAAFDGGAIDYVLKPIEAGRLQKALERAGGRRDRYQAEAGRHRERHASQDGVDRLAITTRQGVVLVDPRDVSHAVLDGELVTVFTTDGAEHLADVSLQELESKLPAGTLERVHRRALVNLTHIVRLEPVPTGGYVARTRRGHAVEVSRQAARALRKRLGLRGDRSDGDEPE